jgi:hypothetical protein
VADAHNTGTIARGNIGSTQCRNLTDT